MRASRLRPLPHVDCCAGLFENASLAVVFALFLVEIDARADRRSGRKCVSRCSSRSDAGKRAWLRLTASYCCFVYCKTVMLFWSLRKSFPDGSRREGLQPGLRCSTRCLCQVPTAPRRSRRARPLSARRWPHVCESPPNTARGKGKSWTHVYSALLISVRRNI